MRRLNILQVCDHLGWTGSRMHGVKRLFAWMIPRFDRDRFAVSLVSLRQQDLSADPLEPFGIDVSYLGRGKFDPATLTDLLKVIDRTKADVLHLHGYGATTFGRIAAAMRRLPVVLHEHANHGDTPGFQKVADRLLAPYTDIALAVSASTAAFVERARQLPAARIRTVYLGAPLDEFARERSAAEVAEARRMLGIPPDAFSIGTVTRLMPAKGNRHLVAAAPSMLDRLPQARITIVGEGELEGELRAQAAALGLGDRLVFAGFHRDVAAVLSAFDLVVFPSLAEGTPLTAFEALAMGRVVVSTDADGLRDILTDGSDAVIVPRENAAAIADAVVALAGDPARRAALAAGARRTGTRYDIATFVRRMEKLYELLHARSRSTRRAAVLHDDLGFLTGDVA